MSVVAIPCLSFLVVSIIMLPYFFILTHWFEIPTRENEEGVSAYYTYFAKNLSKHFN